MFENSLIVVNIKLDNARWFLRGLNKPFDPFAQKAMHDTMIGIANCTEAVWAYHIGNEIVLYLNPNAISRYYIFCRKIFTETLLHISVRMS